MASKLVITQRRSSRGPTGRSARRCARSACAASARTTERPDGPELRGMMRRGRAPRRRSEERQRVADDANIGLHSLRAAARRAQGAQARRPRRGLGLRQDLRPRPEGRRLALRQQAQGRLRGRPEPAAHADAQAARPAHEEVDAVRALPDPHPAGQPRRPEPLRRRRRGDARRRCASRGLATRKRHAGEGARAGRARAQEPGRVGALLQRQGARDDRGRGRHLHRRRDEAARRRTQ